MKVLNVVVNVRVFVIIVIVNFRNVYVFIGRGDNINFVIVEVKIVSSCYVCIDMVLGFFIRNCNVRFIFIDKMNGKGFIFFYVFFFGIFLFVVMVVFVLDVFVGLIIIFFFNCFIFCLIFFLNFVFEIDNCEFVYFIFGRKMDVFGLVF